MFDVSVILGSDYQHIELDTMGDPRECTVAETGLLSFRSLSLFYLTICPPL